VKSVQRAMGAIDADARIMSGCVQKIIVDAVPARMAKYGKLSTAVMNVYVRMENGRAPPMVVLNRPVKMGRRQLQQMVAIYVYAPGKNGRVLCSVASAKSAKTAMCTP
jgi:hypothetical protein